MAAITLTGSGVISTADYRYIKWVGRTKGGKAVSIEMDKALCRSNPDWSFAEKDDTVPEIEFEGVYLDEALEENDRTEPWKITVADGVTAGNGEIILGVGKFYIGTSSSDAQWVGLTRGGGSFTVEREQREINADDDPGAVYDRIVQESGRPKLKFKALQFSTKIESLYAGMKKVN